MINRPRSTYLNYHPVCNDNIQTIHSNLGGATADTDFFTKQARLQTEARMALAQAKEMARMQMEVTELVVVPNSTC